jgi:small subunit ribosomal protein S1
VSIGREVAFVDVGGKGEATIDIDELTDPDGTLEAAVGDRIQAVVVSTAGGLTLSRKLARSAATVRHIEEAFHSGLPVEGRVERAVKGGYEVRIGHQRAFCPISQIDIARAEAQPHEGRVYEFRIIEYKEGGRNIVLSRRALLEERQRPPRSADRSSRARCCRGASRRCASTARSSSSAAACKGCCTPPRCRGRARRRRRRS